MEIRKLTQEDIPELIRFGEEVYPDRKDSYSKLIHFVMDNRIGGYTGGVILVDGDRIVGQSLHTEMNLNYKGINRISGWGYELIVDEKLRKEAWGIEIMLGCRKNFPGACATGSNPNALKLNQKLGYTLVGEIKKYIGLSSILRFPINLLPTKKSFPSEINGFKLINDISKFKERNYFNVNLVEPGRDRNFIKWRYFTPNFKDYKLYQNDAGDWFVVRIIRQKGFNMLLVSDYRCNLDSKDSFSNIYKTIRRIANKLYVPFILCSSSHKITDKVLNTKIAKSIGRPRPIIFAKQFKDWLLKDRINERDFCFITFGDSDGEWNW